MESRYKHVAAYRETADEIKKEASKNHMTIVKFMQKVWKIYLKHKKEIKD